IAVPGGVVTERPDAGGSVVGASGITPERTDSGGGVQVASGVVTERRAAESCVGSQASSHRCERPRAAGGIARYIAKGWVTTGRGTNRLAPARRRVQHEDEAGHRQDETND